MTFWFVSMYIRSESISTLIQISWMVSIMHKWFALKKESVGYTIETQESETDITMSSSYAKVVDDCWQPLSNSCIFRLMSRNGIWPRVQKKKEKVKKQTNPVIYQTIVLFLFAKTKNQNFFVPFLHSHFHSVPVHTLLENRSSQLHFCKVTSLNKTLWHLCSLWIKADCLDCCSYKDKNTIYKSVCIKAKQIHCWAP